MVDFYKEQINSLSEANDNFDFQELVRKGFECHNDREEFKKLEQKLIELVMRREVSLFDRNRILLCLAMSISSEGIEFAFLPFQREIIN